ncbi:MAG TPA: O-methyltransferase [Rickettsiales bacterium]|nr:O-methyltransferase [Rickettsiales bacterium]
MRKSSDLANSSSQLSYIRELYANEDDLLKNIRNQCILDNKAITINPEEGKLLQLLIKLGNIKNIIEIGTLYGYSTIWLVRALPHTKIYTIDKEPENSNTAQKNFNQLENNLSKNIKVINGDAIEELNNMISKNIECDMIFIDADKSNYPEYLKLSEKLIKKGGIIVADNTFLSGGVYQDYLNQRIRIKAQKNMRLFNKMLADKDKYLSIMINTQEGLTIAIKL